MRQTRLTRQHFELLGILAAKELKVRYKSSLLGFLWALLVPLSLMAVFMLVFSWLMKFNLTPAYLLTALFPWTFFSFSVSNAVGTFVDNGSLLKKVSFPRELLPTATVLANFCNFALAMLVLLPLEIRWTPFLAAVPAVMVLQFIFTLGLALLVAAAQVHFRDVRYLVEIALLIWFYLTPVFYSLELVLDMSRTALYVFLLNPMTGLTVLYRDLICHGSISSPLLVTVTACLCLVVFLAGSIAFRRLERNLADHL